MIQCARTPGQAMALARTKPNQGRLGIRYSRQLGSTFLRPARTAWRGIEIIRPSQITMSGIQLLLLWGAALADGRTVVHVDLLGVSVLRDVLALLALVLALLALVAATDVSHAHAPWLV